MSKKKTSLTILFMTILLPLFLSSLLLNAEKAHQPLVPEGETFENLPELLKNISTYTPLQDITFSPDGKTIASGAMDGTVWLWDTLSGTPLHMFLEHNDWVTSVSFSPDGKTLASGSWDSTIRLWDVSKENTTLILKEYKTHVKEENTSSVIKSIDRVTSLSFSPDSKMLASGFWDSTIMLWKVSKKEVIYILRGHRLRVTSLSFNPDGEILASGSDDNNIRLWDVSTGAPLLTLQGHTDSVKSLSFSPDGKTLASGSWDKTIRLWDVSTGAFLYSLQRHKDRVTSVSFSPDGKTIVSGSWDGTVLLWDAVSRTQLHKFQEHNNWISSVSFSPDGKTIASGSWRGIITNRKVDDYKSLWTFVTGQKKNWLSINHENRVWRGDDGTLLVKRDKNGLITPVFPPEPKEKGILKILKKPNSLRIFDGETTNFTIKLKNSGKGKIYWVNVSKDIYREKNNPLDFQPPSKWLILEHGEEVQISCKVWALSSYKNPVSKSSTLYLKITALYNRYQLPILLKIPVDILVPELQLMRAKFQKGEKDLLIVTLKNIGYQATSTDIYFNSKIDGRSLKRLRIEKIDANKALILHFEIPKYIKIEKNSKLSLIAKANSHPFHAWEFLDCPIIFPTPAWYWYVLFSVLFLGSIIGVYYLRLYIHPLTLKLSKTPGELLRLAPQEIPTALNLLRRTQRLDTVLSSISVSKSLLEQAIGFFSDWDPKKKCHYLAERLDARYESILENGIHLFKFHLSRDFILNMEQSQCLVAFPNSEIPAHEILSRIKKVEGANYLVCVFINSDEEQQAELRKSSLNLDNLFVTPESKELTNLLLSPKPLDVFAGLIASQVKVTRISPYQIKSGVNKESVFFGREQLLVNIMQREPANYLLVGARQIGKSSLLKAIERRYTDHPSVECHYLVLEGNEITGHLARTLKFQVNTPLTELLEHMSQGEQGKRRLFLIDEADKFIAAESQTGCATLKHFRSLSEKGKCYFIFAGFWELYYAAVFDYQSPIKNFGEVLPIEALEADACRQLATKPMAMLNIHYESNELVELLIHETGQRANLIAVICNEMLKKLDMTERLIRKEQLEEAFDSKAVISTLSGWEMISSDKTANLLDRVIVYATIGKETFTQGELMHFLESKGVSYEGEQVKQSLERLELAFILKREKQHYSYRVPLFKKMVRQQDPEDLLGRELRVVH